ncbi:hydrogenase formation protein HypD [archaeon]|nr:hydrogenase formation protein HypD [archaeon]
MTTNNTNNIITKINSIAKKINKPVKIMEVCGTHTNAIAKYGIKQVIPKNIKLISGPGCPVCVTPQKTIDITVHLANNQIPIATYGDMLRVPGSEMSLEQAKQNGATVLLVESTIDAIKLKKDHPNLVFLSIGFETTTPMSAWGIKNGLDIICAHKTMPEALQTITENPENQIDGFLNPGHVSSIIGVKAYNQINASQVIAGFESEDILESILMLLIQIKNKEKKVENQYSRIVSYDGNLKAQELVNSVFKKSDSEWRGIGNIKNSGITLKNKYEKHDAIKKYKDILKNLPETKENKACKCAEVIMGKIEPKECPLFSKTCTQDTPIGPCMVGSEGACRISYKYNN